MRAMLDRLFHRPARPGHFDGHSGLAWRGRVEVAPGVWPSREYLLYVPNGYGGSDKRPLVVMLHGCKQTPEELASLTRIAALADRHGWLVLLPRQTLKANAYGCWNWFDAPTVAGQGEAAIVAAQIKSVQRHYHVHPRRVFLAGMSAGGALAAVLALRHPDMFAGVFTHAGLPCGAASSAQAALQAMQQGPAGDVIAIGAAARAAGGAGVRLPLLAVHGEQDDVVSQANAYQLVRQFLALNGAKPRDGAPSERPAPDAEAFVPLADGRQMRVAEYLDGRRVLARLIQVPQLGHAWSGGDPAYPGSDARPPDETALLGEFVEGRLRP
jgi:poly(hydroxyalkanoate) depolymerase family esterase